MIFVAVTMPAEKSEIAKLAKLGLRASHWQDGNVSTGIVALDLCNAERTKVITWVELDPQVKRMPRPTKRRVVREVAQ